ncbi:uncharacterized protein C8A04DRAFT_29896 [Dichotomopilus funicola]|uniref:Uncharacterized protein n=1 Tax=Dichotomopilus funicola TaxID=1934379 RepID=A0AAN6ZL41_9PEZI|nr:hypothetical protein C8A04DRAFT_29896 [Dichotomopilus funicola]
MQLTALTLLASAVASVSAAALNAKATDPETFKLVVRDSAFSQFIGRVVTASNSKLQVSLDDNTANAECEGAPPADGVATLVVRYQSLLLYGGENGSSQQILEPNPNDQLTFPKTPLRVKRREKAVTMQPATLTLLAGIVASVMALTPRENIGNTFSLSAWTNHPQLYNMNIDARESRLWLTHSMDDESGQCTGGTSDSSATFFIYDSDLFLYGGGSSFYHSHQQSAIYTDYPDQGNLRYFNNLSNMPGGTSETKGWAISDGDSFLTFNESSFLVCPESNGLYTLEVHFGHLDDESNKACVSMNLWATPEHEPSACQYSQK